MPAGGYFGRALVVDLADASADVLPLDDDVLRGYIGGAGLALDEHVVAALNGDQITRDPEVPLVAGDSVAFLAADAGG